MKLVFASVMILMFTAAQKAEAQGFEITPFFNTTLTSPSGSGGHTKRGFGVAFGTFGRLLDAETEISYHPEIVDTSAGDAAKSKVLTFSEDLIIGPRIGHVKGYGAIGAGDLHLNVSSASQLVSTSANSVSSNYFSINVGGGAIGFITDRIGIRGDLRYLRAYGIDFTALQNSNLSLTHFDFWRLNIGLTAAF